MSSRTSLPVALPGATRFSDEPELSDDLWAVRTLKRRPQWLNALIEATDLNRNWGRPRAEGCWALAFMAFVVSKHPDIEPWWAVAHDDVWAECGFEGRPSYPTVWNRFIELEEACDAFTVVVGMLVRHARKHSGGEVGRDLHVDGTEAETNAQLIHDCAKHEPCSRRRPDKGSQSRKQKRERVAQRASAKDAREARHKAAEMPVQDEAAVLDLGIAEALIVDEESSTARIRVGGCWFRTHDKTAGIRAYHTSGGALKKFWHGFYNHKAIDHYTGVPVAIEVVSCSEPEHHTYPKLLNRAMEATGAAPRSVVGDRGISLSSVFETNTRLGIASVLPYRKTGRSGEREKQDNEKHDRHGVARCKHCGGPTAFVRFNEKPSPRVWFRCEAPINEGCHKEQSLACSNNWRMLLPLWRTQETYLALRNTHTQYERVHHLWRSRYRVGGDNHIARPKRVGRDWQQLRANAALVIEWLRVLDREGWLGSARRNLCTPIVHKAADALEEFLQFRREAGLHIPYGPNAPQESRRPRRARFHGRPRGNWLPPDEEAAAG